VIKGVSKSWLVVPFSCNNPYTSLLPTAAALPQLQQAAATICSLSAALQQLLDKRGQDEVLQELDIAQACA
jgi:hypothetical protein